MRQWGDVILMLGDALGDRDHDAETAWYCDVEGVSRGDIPVRIVGGPRGAARRLGTHCNATSRLEPVCSAVSGSPLSTPAASSAAGAPRRGALLGGERGFGGAG
jgi:hypothetical protein